MQQPTALIPIARLLLTSALFLHWPAAAQTTTRGTAAKTDPNKEIEQIIRILPRARASRLKK